MHRLFHFVFLHWSRIQESVRTDAPTYASMFAKARRKTLDTGELHPDLDRDVVDLVRPHVDSFNWFLTDGLRVAVSDLKPVHCKVGERLLSLWVDNVHVDKPKEKVFPKECREARTTYAGAMRGSLFWKYGDEPVQSLQRVSFGKGEEPNEVGGYFVVNGNEKMMRMLIMPRRNYPMGVVRPAFTKRGPKYTPYAVSMRCARPDQSTLTCSLHYLSNGTVNFRFVLRRQEFFIPIVLLLKALFNTTDREIYEKVVANDGSNTFVTDRIELCLQATRSYQLLDRNSCLSYLGSKFRVVLDVPESEPAVQVGTSLLKDHILVHQDRFEDKFNTLIFMLRKLFALVKGDIVADNADSPMNQEILLPGHLYCMILKEKLHEWLQAARANVEKATRDSPRADFSNDVLMKKCIERTFDIGRRMEYFLATGNLISSSGLDLMQVAGFVIMAERLNYLRFCAHFRCVHRGAFFSEMKTTSVRKLLPEAWGFLCPVHTPDGAPCGLLNHFAATCRIITRAVDRSKNRREMPMLLAKLGMSPLTKQTPPKDSLPVMLDGTVVGYIGMGLTHRVVSQLRYLKIKGQGVSKHLEIGLIPRHLGHQFSGLYLFSEPARMERPVRFLETGDTEWVGTLEQVYLRIATLEQQLTDDVTHQEIAATNILSLVAKLTPFSDFNQSPRNMYQCQMGKQTMGTPASAYVNRVDNKMYRLYTPQTPIVRTEFQDRYRMDDYPNGTNAIVAVISYTGYDMEDAMIVNKSSYERGFAHGCVYKTEIINLEDTGKRSKSGGTSRRFDNMSVTASDQDRRTLLEQKLDPDGLPHVGTELHTGDPIYSVYDEVEGMHKVSRYKGKERAYVDQVRAIGPEKNAPDIRNASIKLRIPRNPIIGDKFSSRHGQKGILSQLWPHVDMPFTESGMSPDIIINPHAFPSRMTIGMLVESMAGKAGAYHGVFQNATPFNYDERHRAVDYFGQQLLKAGYNYYGNEPLYSGIFGTEFHADIFIGVVFYQRLRHMVSDKYQVRSTGQNNPLTQQPVKGRKRGGGIRFGEMERDSLLAHGASRLLQDRLVNCSDGFKSWMCTLCGSLLSCSTETAARGARKHRACRYCNSRQGIQRIEVPYVLNYLVNELAAMNIRITFATKGVGE